MGEGDADIGGGKDEGLVPQPGLPAGLQTPLPQFEGFPVEGSHAGTLHGQHR